MQQTLNIYRKLIEVRKSVPYLKKDNQGYKFKYVSSSQTLGALRDAMDNQGLLLVPSVTNSEIRDHQTSKGDHEYFTALDITFTWINSENPEEKIICCWTGQGLDAGEKGVGKALTYAEKYFLLKFFNIATDEDDPDSFQGNDAAPKHQQPPSAAPQSVSGDSKAEAKAEKIWCDEHQKWAYLRTNKDGGSWYSHKKEDGKYCNVKVPEPPQGDGNELNIIIQNTKQALYEAGCGTETEAIAKINEVLGPYQPNYPTDGVLNNILSMMSKDALVELQMILKGVA